MRSLSANMYGICLFGFVPLRAAASHTAEQVSQLLWGEVYELLGEQAGWYEVRSLADGYTGWLHEAQHSSRTAGPWLAEPFVRGVAMVQVCNEVGERRWLSHGSFWVAGWQVCWQEASVSDEEHPLVREALRYLGTPYLWGGKTIWGTDCSGLVQQAARACGVPLPRDAWQQAGHGEPVSFESRQAGDLAFFLNDKGRVHHVGICLSDGRLLHASGSVRINQLTTEGVCRPDGTYSHHSPFVRRINLPTKR